MLALFGRYANAKKKKKNFLKVILFLYVVSMPTIYFLKIFYGFNVPFISEEDKLPLYFLAIAWNIGFAYVVFRL